jgi:hypothetical protein
MYSIQSVGKWLDVSIDSLQTPWFREFAINEFKTAASLALQSQIPAEMPVLFSVNQRTFRRWPRKSVAKIALILPISNA